VALGAAAAAAAADDPTTERPGPLAGGRLMWMVSDDLDLVGDLWADLPLAPVGSGALRLGIDTRTTIERAESTFTFEVHDLIYDVELGWRAERPGHVWDYGFAVGQRGRERVDADGQPWVRWVGATVGTVDRPVLARAREGGSPFAFWVTAGAVIEERETRADAVVRGAARFRFAPSATSIARGFVLDARLDGLVDGSHFAADFEIGPALDFDVAHERVAFFLRYLHSGNPLGTGTSGLLAGFEYEGPTDGHPGAAEGRPSIEGVVSAGAGEDSRLAGQLLLRFASPRFFGKYQARAEVDANILTADDTGDLYYYWDVGIERPMNGSLAGVYVHHRSNHELAEPNERVTSLNVLDVGVRTPDADRPGLRQPRRRRGSFEGRAHAGVVLNSSFGEDRFWHVRGALRWSLRPWAARFGPFVRGEAEAGDVDRYTVALGASVGTACDLEVQYRSDQQYASADQNVLLLLARYGF